nr:hypothetical protein [uncultured Allomuricauda sp.]
MNEEKLYFEESFFKTLKDRANNIKNPLDITSLINRAYGKSISGSAKKFLEFHANFIYEGFGGFYPIDLRPPGFQDENLYKSLLADPQIGLIQIFTESIAIGNDASGQIYLLHLDDEKSSVYIYDPGSSAIRFLADSIESFTFLCHIFSDWLEFEEIHVIDVEDIIDGNIPNSLDVSSFRKKLIKLSGKVNLSDPKEEFFSDYDERFTAIHGKKLSAFHSGNTAVSFERAKWIMRLLNNQLGEAGDMPPLSATKDYEPPKGSSDILYWLWRNFFKDNADLKKLLKKYATHNARIITDTISLITALLDDEKSYQEFNYLRLQRMLLNGGKEHEEYDKIFSQSFLNTNESEDHQIRLTKERVRMNSEKANNWDDLAYCYYTAQEWNSVLYCSRMSLSLKPESYYAWMQQGIALWQLKKHKEALKAFDYGLCYDGNHDLWLNKAFVYLEMKDPENAIAHLQQLPSNKRAKLIGEHKEFDVLKSEQKYLTLFQD